MITLLTVSHTATCRHCWTTTSTSTSMWQRRKRARQPQSGGFQRNPDSNSARAYQTFMACASCQLQWCAGPAGIMNSYDDSPSLESWIGFGWAQRSALHHHFYCIIDHTWFSTHPHRIASGIIQKKKKKQYSTTVGQVNANVRESEWRSSGSTRYCILLL